MQSGREDTLEERYAIKSYRIIMLQKRMECSRLLFDFLAWSEHQSLSGIRDSKKPGSLWGMMRGVGGVRKSMHQSWLAKGLGLLWWGFKGFQEEIHREEASTLQIGSVASRQFLGLSIIQTLLPVIFVDSLTSEAVVMRQLRWKSLWRR